MKGRGYQLVKEGSWSTGELRSLIHVFFRPRLDGFDVFGVAKKKYDFQPQPLAKNSQCWKMAAYRVLCTECCTIPDLRAMEHQVRAIFAQC
jgi:hypothetical protein